MGVTPWVAPIGTADGLRVKPDNFAAPEGEHSIVLGSDVPGIFRRFTDGDRIGVRQNADFDVTTIFSARMKVRGPVRIPEVVEVTSATTSTYTVTINGTDFSYAADTTGLLIQSGAAASIVSPPPAFPSVVAVDGLTNMSVASLGRRLVVTGAATPANNGTFPIGILGLTAAIIDDTQVVINNQAGVAGDANNGSISWEERRIPDDAVNRIAAALVALINAGSEPVTARLAADGVFTIERDDPKTPFTLSTAGNLSNASITWRASLEIDSVKEWQEVIEPGRTRELFDVKSLIVPKAGGNHDLDFILALECSLNGQFDLEIPAFYVDALVFDETT